MTKRGRGRPPLSSEDRKATELYSWVIIELCRDTRGPLGRLSLNQGVDRAVELAKKYGWKTSHTRLITLHTKVDNWLQGQAREGWPEVHAALLNDYRVAREVADWKVDAVTLLRQFPKRFRVREFLDRNFYFLDR